MWVEHALQIEGVDPDNARVVVKLAIGGQTVTISQYGIKLVDRKEYERNSKDLSEYRVTPIRYYVTRFTE